MATVTVVQPKIGTITVLSQTAQAVTVRWNLPAQGDGVFKGFKLYCHACGGTLVYLQTNPATFNIGELTSDGHPGPFEISSVADGSGDLYVYTDVAEGEGSTKAWQDGVLEKDATDSFSAEVAVGSQLVYRIKAYPGFGHVFDHWDRDGNYYSSSQSLRITFNKSNTNETERQYDAYFVPGTYSLSIRIYTDGKTSTSAKGGSVNGSSTGSRVIGSYQYGDISPVLTAVASPGYRFVRWIVETGSDQGKGPHRGETHAQSSWQFVMPGVNTRIAAYFESLTGSLLYGSSGLLLHGHSGQLVYDGD